jgi:phage terminase small subunit
MATVSNRPLTSKQRAFADYVAAGKNLSDSYRAAYDAERMKPASIHQNACRLAGHVNVTARIEQQQAVKDRALIACSVSDRELVLRTLRDTVHDTEEATVNRLRATELLGRTVGIFKSDQEQPDKHRTPAEIQAELQEILGKVLVLPDNSKVKN